MKPSLARTMRTSLESWTIQGNLSVNKERIETEPDHWFTRLNVIKLTRPHRAGQNTVIA